MSKKSPNDNIVLDCRDVEVNPNEGTRALPDSGAISGINPEQQEEPALIGPMLRALKLDAAAYTKILETEHKCHNKFFNSNVAPMLRAKFGVRCAIAKFARLWEAKYQEHLRKLQGFDGKIRLLKATGNTAEAETLEAEKANTEKQIAEFTKSRTTAEWLDLCFASDEDIGLQIKFRLRPSKFKVLGLNLSEYDGKQRFGKGLVDLRAWCKSELAFSKASPDGVNRLREFDGKLGKIESLLIEQKDQEAQRAIDELWKAFF